MLMGVLFGFDLNVLVVFVRALQLVSVPVLKLVLCIMVLARVSSGNTSIHMSADIFFTSDINTENN